MNMIVTDTSLAYVISKNKIQFVDFDANSNAHFVFMFFSLIGERDSKE